ncbi:MAG: acetyl-CoA C-acyltransferase FadI [Longimicrobiaceae bacterium]
MNRNGRRVAIVAGCRTPFAKSGTAFKQLSALELGVAAVRELISRADLDPAEIDHTIYGTVVQSLGATNLAREVGFGAGIPASAPAFTVGRACASASQAITSAAAEISMGYADTVMAGGAESLSDIPILFSPEMRGVLMKASKAKSLGGRFKAFASIRPRHLVPQVPAIAERTTGLTMGESAEKMARENGVSRQEQDRWALRSHKLAAAASDDGRLPAEIAAVFVEGAEDGVVSEDNGIRRDTSLEQLAALKPVFDRRYGSITAGNSSPLTDGASAVLLMSEHKAKSLGYEPLGYVRSWAYAALDPADQLLQGPVYAAPVALERAGMTMQDVELLEMHEAFAAQVLSTLQWWGSKTVARERLGRSEPVGVPDEDRVNVTGGSIAIGHPFGATGGRILISLLNEMGRRGVGVGMVSVCAAGGMGHVMIVER